MKIVEKSEDYQHMITDQSDLLSSAQLALAQTQSTHEHMRTLEQEKLAVSTQIIEELSARLRARDRDYEKLRGFKDREQSRERQRMSKMLDRGQ